MSIKCQRLFLETVPIFGCMDVRGRKEPTARALHRVGV